MPTSGRVYSSREGGYNVNIGFCDNSVDTHVSPASYTYLGPNAEAGKHCGPEFGFEACQKPS